MIKTFVILYIIMVPTITSLPFDVGEGFTYTLKNDVIFKDFKGGKNYSYRLLGKFEAGCVWGVDDVKLLRFRLLTASINVIPNRSYNTKNINTVDSNKVDENELNYISQDDDNYKTYNSALKHINNEYFYAAWNTGDITKFFFKHKEPQSILNLKKAIVSLFQYKDRDGDYNENDVSGNCDVTYKTKSFTRFKKIKKNCKPNKDGDDKNYFSRFDESLGISIKSNWMTQYKTRADATASIIKSKELHRIYVESNENIGSEIESIIFVKMIDGSKKNITAENMEAVSMLKETGNHQILLTELEAKCELSKCDNLKDAIKMYKDNLKNDKIGKAEMALAFAKLIPIARRTDKDDLSEILNSHTPHDIKETLMDILGATQTKQSYDVVLNVITFTNENDESLFERYLQALAVATRPSAYIIQNLLKFINNGKSIDPKLKDTLIQTIASMTNRYAMNLRKYSNEKLVIKVMETILHKLNECTTDQDCKALYLRALQNLQSPKTINILLEYVLKNNNERIVSVAAIKALNKIPSNYFTKQIQNQLYDIFFQRFKKYDSSVRTVALDILLKLKPSRENLLHLLEYLKSNDKAYEVKQYLLQNILMLSEKCSKFKADVKKILAKDRTLNNYHIIGQKGLSTALYRRFLERPSFNSSLLSVQEMNGGILKRGTVDITIEANNKNKFSLFTLELYAGGLSSFMSSSEEDDDEIIENQQPTAGMEITVQNSYFRPLKFFNGQTELMGHVWSGTASEPTTAYKASMLLHDHQQFLRLENGAALEIHINGAVSIDLNGQIQISIWNRNAHCQVDQNIGVAIVGSISLNTNFINMHTEFNTVQEPKVELISDIDFSSDPLLCMQLRRPGSILSHQIFREQNIPTTNYDIQSTTKINQEISGCTFALNQKNNEMCNKINS